MMRLYLGGSFDPVHDGHLDMIRHVAHRLSSHEVATRPAFDIYFLPTAGNPFKDKPTDSIHRLAMLSLACQLLRDEDIHTTICPLEIHQTPPVYTIDTAHTLAKNHAGDECIFIMGDDSLVNLHLWRSYEDILNFVKIWSFARVGVTDDVQPSLSAKTTTDFDEFLTSKHKVIFRDATPTRAISSSQIRTMIQQGKTPPHLPTPILEYIKQHELYKNML